MIKLGLLINIVFFSIILFSCKQSSEKTNIATQGTINYFADETFSPLISAQEYIFESIYKKANLEIEYAPEGTILNNFLNDTIENIIISRRLNKEEIEYLNSKKYSAQQTLIAYDALVIIANNSFQDSSISIEKIEGILRGKFKLFSDLNSKFSSEPIKFAIDNINSSNLYTLKNRFNIDTLSGAVVAVGSSKGVVDYVKNNPNSIGVVGWSLISDEEDPAVISMIKNIKIVSVGVGNNYFKPAQMEVRDSLYPLTRGIYSINKGYKAGLGAGFSTFMASDRGQRIVLKHGIVPHFVPGREIEIKE